MSYDIKLSKVCDNKVVWDDHIVESDFKTVELRIPVSNSNMVVRINDFKRSKEFQNEFLIREDVSSQVTGSNNTFFVSKGPIYSGLKLKKLETRKENIIVRVKVTDEDASGQFTGIENYFFTQGKPLLKSNNYDFNSFLEKKDVQITLNGVLIEASQIDNIDPRTGRIQLNFIPITTDIVKITYYYRAKIKEFDAQQSRVTIKEIPKSGQEVFIVYYSLQNDGWYLQASKRGLIQRTQDIVFYRNKNTNRFFINKEYVSNQLDGTNKQFVTSSFPILPLYQVFSSLYADTLNNAVIVFLNDVRIPISGIDPEKGLITLFQTPKTTDVVQISYYYEEDLIPDRISVDYYTDSTYCDKCSKYSDLIDYTIDKLGKYEKVFDENKLIQDLKKIVRTILGSDPVATWYGTTFDKIIGSKSFPEIIKTKIASEIYTAFSKLKSAQIRQEEYQVVTDNEFLNVIQSVSVEESTAYPTLYEVKVELVTQSGRLVAFQETVQTKG